ncbi:MAG: YraN family protein [Planctomycetales bacterium]
MIGWIRKLLGNRGERAAARFLRRQGYRILARQHASRFGEIDLIARDGEWIVFVEVKTRRSDVAGLPVEAVDQRKQRQMTRAALAWLKRRGLLDHRSRFDVIGILWPEGSRQPRIDHYRNAFPGVE